MPYGDGSGPQGKGPSTGRGTGSGRKKGRTGGGRAGIGPGGYCVCQNCGEKVPHQQGVPCYSVTCPKCGARMIRG